MSGFASGLPVHSDDLAQLVGAARRFADAIAGGEYFRVLALEHATHDEPMFYGERLVAWRRGRGESSITIALADGFECSFSVRAPIPPREEP